MEYTMKGIINIISMIIYVNSNSMANIISPREVANSFSATMDTKEDHAILVNLNKDNSYLFKECVNGLYYLDVSDQ